MKNPMRTLLVLGAFAALVPLCTPSESHAQVAYYAPAPAVVVRPVYRPLFPRLGWRRQPTAVVAAMPITAMPVTAMRPVSGCTTCYKPACPTTVCRYVAQTCYRQQSYTVPVTTYRPVTSCDPCTGCTTTCMKPVTTYVQQTRRVPYTTYRMVCSTQAPTCAPACSLGGCSTGGCSTGGCSTCSASPICATCGTVPVAATGASCATCSTTSNTMAPVAGRPPGAAGHTGDVTPRPTLSPEPTKAYKPEVPETSVRKLETPEVKVEPMRDLEARPTLGPELYDTNDKTAMLAPPAVQRVSMANAPSKPTRHLDDSGWHAVAR